MGTKKTWILRAPGLADAPAVASLMNACAVADFGSPDTSAEALRAEWEDPALVLEDECRLAQAPDGEVLGFAEVWNVAEGEAQNLQAYVHVAPGCGDPELGRRLWDWAESAACREYARTHSTHPHTLWTTAETNSRARAVLEARGFRPVRHSWRMAVALDAPGPAPAWPAGVTVRAFVPGQDERAVFAARSEGTEDMWGCAPVPFELWEYHLIRGNPHFDPSLWFLAAAGEEVVGICLCQPRTAGDPRTAEVRSVMIRRHWRRRGIATALLRHAFIELARRGIPRAGLEVDAESLTGANRVYQNVGMRVTRRYDTWQKDLTC